MTKAIIVFVSMGIIFIIICLGGRMFGWNTEVKRDDVKLLFRVIFKSILDFLKAIYNMGDVNND